LTRARLGRPLREGFVERAFAGGALPDGDDDVARRHSFTQWPERFPAFAASRRVPRETLSGAPALCGLGDQRSAIWCHVNLDCWSHSLWSAFARRPLHRGLAELRAGPVRAALEARAGRPRVRRALMEPVPTAPAATVRQAPEHSADPALSDDQPTLERQTARAERRAARRERQAGGSPRQGRRRTISIHPTRCSAVRIQGSGLSRPIARTRR
jgi:hypothetical protein